jgi:hypothetical protein
MPSPKRSYPLKDARRDLVLTVTVNDIKTAVRKDNNECAAAHALCRQEKRFVEARVNRTTTLVKLHDGSWERFLTPKDLYVELMIYDRGGKMEAGQFILQAPKGCKKLGAHHKPRGPHLRTGKPPRKMHIIENVRDASPKGRNLMHSLFD